MSLLKLAAACALWAAATAALVVAEEETAGASCSESIEEEASLLQVSRRAEAGSEIQRATPSLCPEGAHVIVDGTSPYCCLPLLGVEAEVSIFVDQVWWGCEAVVVSSITAAAAGGAGGAAVAGISGAAGAAGVAVVGGIAGVAGVRSIADVTADACEDGERVILDQKDGEQPIAFNTWCCVPPSGSSDCYPFVVNTTAWCCHSATPETTLSETTSTLPETTSTLSSTLGCTKVPAGSCGNPSIKCFWDDNCLSDGGLCCKADGKTNECRFCGVGDCPACPVVEKSS